MACLLEEYLRHLVLPMKPRCSPFLEMWESLSSRMVVGSRVMDANFGSSSSGTAKSTVIRSRARSSGSAHSGSSGIVVHEAVSVLRRLAGRDSSGSSGLSRRMVRRSSGSGAMLATDVKSGSQKHRQNRQSRCRRTPPWYLPVKAAS